MRPSRFFAAVLIVCTCLAAFTAATLMPAAEPESEWKVYYLYERGTLANGGQTPIKINKTDRWFNLPMNLTHQKSFLINTSHRISRSFLDNDSTPTIELDLPPEIPPLSYVQFSVTHKLMVKGFVVSGPELLTENSGKFDDIPVDLISNMTSATGPWLYEDPGMVFLVTKARELAGGSDNVLEVLLQLIDWIGPNTRYPVGDEMAEGPRYPNETCSMGVGDCDDQANALILMCRSLGIPAYLQMGGVVSLDIEEATTVWDGHLYYYDVNVGWHGWGMVFVPPWGWLPVDLVWGYYAFGKERPLEAILFSAVGMENMVYLGNVYVTDYVREYRKVRDTTTNSELYLYFEHVLVLEGESISEVKAPPLEFPWTSDTTTTSTSLTTSTTPKQSSMTVTVDTTTTTTHTETVSTTILSTETATETVVSVASTWIVISLVVVVAVLISAVSYLLLKGRRRKQA